MKPTRHHASACQGGPDTDTRESDQQNWSGVANSQLCFPKRAFVSRWYAALQSSPENYCNFEIQFVNVWKLQKGQITKVFSLANRTP